MRHHFFCFSATTCPRSWTSTFTGELHSSLNMNATWCPGLVGLGGWATLAAQPASLTRGKMLRWRGRWSRWSIFCYNVVSAKYMFWTDTDLIFYRFLLMWSSPCQTGLLGTRGEATTNLSIPLKFKCIPIPVSYHALLCLLLEFIKYLSSLLNSPAD